MADRGEPGVVRTDWSTPVGSVLSREERRVRYGGALYGGIEPSATTPNVFVYSDPSRGEVHGYNFDGWTTDRSVFLYTGEGQRGDQLMREGNKAILEHAERGRALRLFIAEGLIPGTSQKNQRYIGEFRVDAKQPFVQEDAPDESGETRTVFVFRMVPVGEALQRPAEDSGLADAPTVGQSDLIDREIHAAPTFETSGHAPSTAERRESELVERYVKFLGRRVRRWRLRPPGELRSMLTDIYDEAERELYEAKGTASRAAIREALGQLLDYRRHIAVDGLKLCALVPSRPSDDLLDLLGRAGIACVFESASGFERVTRGPGFRGLGES